MAIRFPPPPGPRADDDSPPIADAGGGGGGPGRFLCGGGGGGRLLGGGVAEFDLEGLPGGAGGCDMVVTAVICIGGDYPVLRPRLG